MTKRPATDDYYDVNSSDDDEFHINFYAEMLERLTLGHSDSSDDEDAPPRRQVKCRVESDSDNNSGSEENVRQPDNVSLSEEWEDVTESGVTPTTMDFDLNGEEPGPQLQINLKEPIEYFKLFFTEELIERIIKDTNDFAEEEIKRKDISRKIIWYKWYDLTKEEFMAYIAVVLNMGMIQLPKIQEYWSTADNTRIPFFAETFSRNRFMQIFWMLHMNKPNKGNETLTTRIQKASQYLEYIDGKFRQYFIPHESIIVDETIVKIKGKISFITYNPSQPSKWGIRVYALVDSKTGYLFTILPYYGTITTDAVDRPDLPVSARIPLKLYKRLMERVPSAKGYHMFTDKYYTSIVLAEELRKMNCHLTGEMIPTSKGVPEPIKEPKFTDNKLVAYKKDDITLLAWKDKQMVVTMLTNYYNTQEIVTQKILPTGDVVTVTNPEMVVEFAGNMIGGQRADQNASTYCFLRRSLKWWRQLFYLGLEMCVINSYIVYRTMKQANNERSMTHYKFVKTLIDQLRGDYRESRNGPSASTSENRLDRKLHVMDKEQNKRDCVVCTDRKVPAPKRQTGYFCMTCANHPAMHIGECFRIYHTSRKYRK